MRVLASLLLILLATTGAAEARHHRHGRAAPPAGRACEGWFCGWATPQGQLPASGASSLAAGAVVAHPLGCPGRAFCGCGAAVRLFGRPVRSLYLAAAWLRFPRAAPAPGMAAARRHHVMVLESHVGGDVWVVYDANSGGHATRVHARSIAGYTIVDPRA